MKILSIIFGCLFLSINIIIGQTASLKYLPYNGKVGTQYSYDAEAEVVRNRTTHDYGPRDKTVNGVYDAYDWHGGIDYNTVSPFNGQDRGNIGLAVEGGTIVETGLSGSTHFIVVNGTHKTAYVHIWDGCSSIHDGATHYYEGCIVKPMDGNNSSQWALIFRINGAYSAIGSVKNFPATVTFSDNGTNQTINVTDYVAAGSPVAPIGTSCSSKFPYHYHVQAITDINNGLSDGNDKNALEYIQNNENSLVPNYNVSLRNQNGNVGVQLVDDGSKKSTLSARIDLDPAQSNNGSVEDYNIVINHEKVEFYLKKPNGEKIQVQGPDYDKIQIGGKTGSNVIPDYMNKSDSKPNADIIGKWTQSGIEPHCYNGHRYDDYFLYNFVKRIHTDDIMGDNNLQLAICPDEARFPDGKYDVLAKMTTITDATFDSPTITTVVDNFKPYIKSVTITANGKAYVRNVSCGTCGIELGAATGDPFSSADLANGFTVSATISEPMKTFQLAVAAIGYDSGVSTSSVVASNNNQTYVFTVPTSVSMPSSGKVELKFNGVDLASNQILNLSTITGCRALPIRTGTGDNNWSTFISGGGEISFSFPICNGDIQVPLTFGLLGPSSCDKNDAQVLGVVANGNITGLTFEWFWLKSASNWESIGVGINPIALKTLYSGQYKVVATNVAGCKGEKLFKIWATNDIKPVFSATEPCQGLKNGALTISIPFQNPAGYDITWTGIGLSAPVSVIGKTSSTINNLGIGKYYAYVRNTGVVNDACARVFEYELKASSFNYTDITAKVKHPCKFKTNGQIVLDYQKFGTPYTIKWSSPIAANTQGSITQFGLGATIYTVEVTNHCGQTATQSFDLKEIDNKMTLEAVTNSDCTSDIVATIPTSLNLPIKYFFDELALGTVVGNKLTNLKGSGIFNVKATDSNGCIANQSIDFHAPYYSIGTRGACKGATGGLTLWIHNPNGAVLDVKTAGIPQTMVAVPNSTVFKHHHHYAMEPALGSLTAGFKVPVSIMIGSCKTVETVEIPSYPSEKTFDKYQGNEKEGYKCLYKEKCDGESIKDDKGNFVLHEEPADIGENTEYKSWGKTKCKNTITCPDPNDKTKKVFSTTIGKTKVRKGKVGDFIAFLEKEKIRVPGNAFLIDEIIKRLYKDILSDIQNPPKNGEIPLSLCTKVKWCPTNYSWSYTGGNVQVSVNVGVTLGDDDKPISIGNGCYEYKCGTSTIKSCPPPPSTGVIVEPTIDNCNSINMDAPQLYIWYADLLANYPKFKGSELQKCLDDNVNDKRINCTLIRYCQNDFSIINYPPVSKVTCAKNYYTTGEVFKETCVVKTNPETGQLYVDCFNGWNNKFETSFKTTPVLLDKNPKYNPKFVGIPNTNKVVLDNNENTEFNGFTYSKDKSRLELMGVSLENRKNLYVPWARLKGEQSEENFNFSNIAGYQRLTEVEDEVFDIYDTDEDEEISTSSIINSKLYTLNYTKGEDTEWLANIQAEKSIKVEDVIKNAKSIDVVGHFQGTLSYNLKELAISEEDAAFEISVDYAGNLLDFHIVENIDKTNTIFYEGENGMNIVTTTISNEIKSNGISIGVDGKNNIFDFDLANNKIINAIPFVGNVKVSKFAKDKTLNKSYYLLSADKNSKESVQVANISFEPNEHFY